MKNQKTSTIPPLIQNSVVINDPQDKSELLNYLFVGKATVSVSDDPVPILPIINSVFTSLSSINTSPIEVSKVLRQQKKSNNSHCGILGKFINIIATPIAFSLSRVFTNSAPLGRVGQ